MDNFSLPRLTLMAISQKVPAEESLIVSVLQFDQRF